MKKILIFLMWAIQLATLQVQADTVVGIHGFITDWRSLKPIDHVLKKCGLNVYLWNYQSRRKCIAEHASDLIPVLQEIACCCPGSPIHFVTHSTGALVLRSALNLPGCPQEAKIGRAVLMAPPNQGTSLAHRFRGFWPVEFAMGDKSGWELRNYGPWEMATQIGEFPPSMEVLVIAGTKGNLAWFSEPNDGLITVSETFLNTPYYLQCYRVTHGDIMKNSCVLCCMKNFIYGWYCTHSEPAWTGGSESSQKGY
jgi:hypothetical protein